MIFLREYITTGMWTCQWNIEELGSLGVSSPGFWQHSKMDSMTVRFTKVLDKRDEDRYLALALPKKTELAQHQTCLVSSLQLTCDSFSAET
ncbi:hypothetical protein AVEN_176958-1 [Araneus ventricosus]|uniref:Uncharacterized protein n=1 Tax=Araneus ventricosus TaxID=182803 RepID=A0A4Y2EGL6_ARAVE|nr:hypothetical protein AVEN_176958-1 [Araneus ventricosus]